MQEAMSEVKANSIEAQVKIQNTQGLHARPAAQFVRVASKYPECELSVTKEEITVNGKSIIGIMMLAAGPGTTLKLEATGTGADQLLTDLRELIDGRFGEE